MEMLLSTLSRLYTKLATTYTLAVTTHYDTLEDIMTKIGKDALTFYVRTQPNNNTKLKRFKHHVKYSTTGIDGFDELSNLVKFDHFNLSYIK